LFNSRERERDGQDSAFADGACEGVIDSRSSRDFFCYGVGRLEAAAAAAPKIHSRSYNSTHCPIRSPRSIDTRVELGQRQPVRPRDGVSSISTIELGVVGRGSSHRHQDRTVVTGLLKRG
jgi:hypothetical protein